MAGRGPAPKPKGSRARRNKDPQILRIITAQPVKQPSLPVIEQVVLDENGKPRKKRFTWPTVTRRWWKMWGESPLSAEYTETDWSFLLDTAYLGLRVKMCVWLGVSRGLDLAFLNAD